MEKIVQNNIQNDTHQDEVFLREVFSIIWDGKFKIIALTSIFAVASVFYALSIPNQYKATALLAPAQSSVGGISSASSQMGGLAALAGISVGGGNTSEAEIAQRIMQSWSFIEDFINNNDLSAQVFAVNGWNKDLDELQIDDGLYDVVNKQWVLEDDNGQVGPPNSWDMFKKFSKRLEVSEIKKSNLLSVSIEFYSPFIAKKWVDMYVAAINLHMQNRQVIKTTKNIDYLEAQIQKTSIAEMRKVFYSIMEEQTKNKMLAEATPEYAFVVVSPTMVPEEKSQPARASICILITLLGGMVSCLLILVLHRFRNK